MTVEHQQPLVRKSAWSAAAGMSMALGNIVNSIVVARLLGPDGTGEVAYLLWVAATATVVVHLGLPACMQRFVAELTGNDDLTGARRLAQRLSRNALCLASVAGCLGTICVLVFADSGDRTPYFALVALFAMHAGSEVFRSQLAGYQRFQLAAKFAVSTAVLQMIGITVGATFWGVTGALLGYALGFALPATFSVRLAFTNVAPAATRDKTLRTRMRRYSLNTYMAAIVSFVIWTRIEVLFLQPAWGDKGVAMFTTGLTVATLASQGPLLLAGALLSHMTERIAAGDIENVRKTYASATRILGALVLPMCLGTAAIAPELVPLMYGGEFVDAVPVTVILATTGALGAISSVSSYLLYAMERSRFIFLGGSAGAVLAVGGFALVVPVFGPVGAAWTRALVQTLMVALGAWYVRYRLDVPVPLTSLARSAAAALLCALAASTCVLLLSGPIALVIAIPSGALVYVVVSRSLHALESDDLRMLHAAAALLPAPLAGPARALAALVLRSPR